jgi:hypothetical protein
VTGLRWLDRAWFTVALAVAALPLGLAFVLPFPGADGEQQVARLIAGALVSAQLAWWVVTLRPITRPFRTALRRVGIAWVLVPGLVAASPVGAAVVTVARRLPGRGGLLVGLLPALFCIAVVGWQRLLERRMRLRLGLILSVGVVLREVLFRRGLLLYAAAALFFPTPSLVFGVLAFVAVEFVLNLVNTRVELEGLRIIDSGKLVGASAADRRDVLGGWLHDAILRRPWAPDLSLISSLCGHSARSGWGSEPRDRRLSGWPRRRAEMPTRLSKAW